MRKIKISKRKIGDGEPTLVIAEVGSNHNGILGNAKKLVDFAVDAQADAIKFQVFRAAKVYPKRAGIADYLKTNKSIFEIIKHLEMPYEWIPELFDYCKNKGIIFLASHFDEESADRLDEVGVSAFKIASYECNHIPLIKHTAKKGKPIIMSTGLSSLGEIEESLEAIYSQGNRDVALMHCIASYPAPLEHTNLRVINTLKTAFNVPVGLSDHSLDPLVAPLAAVTIGANIVEKHFTMDRRMKGPDHKFSLTLEELKIMVKSIRSVERALGSGVKIIAPSEEELYKFGKRRIHAIKKIRKGEKLTERNLAILRPGKLKPGLAPKYWDIIIGKTAAVDIMDGEGITFNMVNLDS